MQLKVKVDNKWVGVPATTEIADDITSDKLTYSSKKIEELISNAIANVDTTTTEIENLIGEVVNNE